MKVQKTLTAAQIKALNATPIELVAAPGDDKALIFKGALITKSAGTAYDGIAAGEDLAIKYENGSGTQVAQAECTGFMDSATKEITYLLPTANFVKVAENKALVAHMLTGEIATGTCTLTFDVEYDVINV